MLSRGREYHLAPGSPLTLDCEFYMASFHGFHNPVIWVKSQSTPANGGSQRIKINVMGIIQAPFFDDEDRFDVSFIKQPPRYELLLTVRGIYQWLDISLDVSAAPCRGHVFWPSSIGLKIDIVL